MSFSTVMAHFYDGQNLATYSFKYTYETYRYICIDDWYKEHNSYTSGSLKIPLSQFPILLLFVSYILLHFELSFTSIYFKIKGYMHFKLKYTTGQRWKDTSNLGFF